MAFAPNSNGIRPQLEFDSKSKPKTIHKKIKKIATSK